MHIFKKKGRTIVGIVAGALIAAGVSFAFFTTTGSGLGSAQTGTIPLHLTIKQIGAGYDSLAVANNYHQDQTYGGAGITEFGNDITLANAGTQRLTSVVVAMRNWGGSLTNLPITLSINNGQVSKTQDFSFPAAANGRPSVTSITFDFTSQKTEVPQEFVFGISWDTNTAPSLNVALSSSALNLSVGSDTDPGTVWLNTTYSTIGNDFPTCTTAPYPPGVPTGVWEKVVTNCGPDNPNNLGAYGTTEQVANGNADIPAIEFNVVGGIVPVLFPGGPSQPVDYAITNPNTWYVHVHQVTTSVASLSNTGSDGTIEACSTGMYPIANAAAINASIPPGGTTLFSPSGTSISMTDDGHNQNNCQGDTVNLSFASN